VVSRLTEQDFAPPGSQPLQHPARRTAAARPFPFRGAGQRWGRTLAGRIAVGAVFATAGLLFITSAQTARGSDLRGDATDLRSLVQQQEDDVAAHDRRVAALRRQVEGLTATVGDPGVKRVAGTADRLAAAAGATPVSGAGLQVSLDDAARNRAVPDGVVPDTLIVHQQDVQAVVNAMWAGGATAVALQGQRVISTSAVRCVGNVLHLQGRLYAPPFTVAAVGDPSRLAAALSASPAVGAYLRDVQRVGLGWELKTEDALTVPAWAGSLSMVRARVLTPPPGSSASSSAGSSAGGTSS
jgi:uncharacterized protein YlxW (UPF0749 family)